MIIDHNIYHARCYRRKGEKSDSCVIKLKCGTYGAIYRIIDPGNFVGQGEPKPLILIRKILIEREPVISHQAGAKAMHIKLCSLIVFGDFMITTPDTIFGPAILMNCIDRSYIADFPNTFEKD